MMTLANPYLLLILPLPLLLRFMLTRAPQPNHATLRVPFYNRIQKILSKSTSKNKILNHKKNIPLILIWILLVIAASGPRWLGKPVQIMRQGHNIILALDISGSMQIPDMTLNKQPVDRLTLVKKIAADFIHKRDSDRLALILFGSRAYLQTPLTFDRKTVEYMLQDASIGLAGPATALGDAIGLGIKRLIDTDKQNRVIILLTDGSNNTGVLDPIQAARLAKDNHVKIYTIGLGASQLIVPGLFGKQVVNPSQDLDQKTLKQIAKTTDGLFFRAKNAGDLQQVYQTIDKLEPIKADVGIYRPISEFYIWPASMALLLSCFLALKQLMLFSRAKQLESEASYG